MDPLLLNPVNAITYFFYLLKKEGLIDSVKKDFLEGIYLPKLLAYCMNLVKNKNINKSLFMRVWNNEKNGF